MSTWIASLPRSTATPGEGLSRLALTLLLAAYLLPGLVPHDPWKPDEPYTFGVSRAMLQTGDWVVPRVADVPFVEKPPLFYWAGAVAIRALPFLPPHDAARIASLFFVIVSLAATAAATRLCWGKRSTQAAALMLLASLGLEGHAQRLQVDLALMAGFAIAMLGLAGHTRARWWSGLAIGAGAGIGFLAKGVIGPAAIALACVLLPVLFVEWRSRAYARRLGEAALVALPLVMGWPFALWLRDAGLLHEWFWNNNVGRFLGFSVAKLGAEAEPGFWPRTLPWFLFPVWLYAARTFIRRRGIAWRLAGVQIGMALASIMLLVLLASASGRAVYALPLLPPFALIAAGEIAARDGRIARTLGAAAIALAAVGAIAMWTLWAVLAGTGRVPAWTQLQDQLPVPFAMPVQPAAVALALLLTAGFAALVILRDRIANAALMLWTGAMALVMGLAMTLWLPWIDAAKSYREVLEQAGMHAPRTCLMLRGMGESEQAMLEYYAGLRGSPPSGTCDALLWMGKAGSAKRRPPDTTWSSVWSGRRAGETVERFELFVRK